MMLMFSLMGKQTRKAAKYWMMPVPGQKMSSETDAMFSGAGHKYRMMFLCFVFMKRNEREN